MKSVFGILTLIVFVYIQLFNGMIWMSYEINKSEIIQKFCENIDKPEMKCEGTCHMKKMMLTEEPDQEGETMMILPEIELYQEDYAVEIENQMVLIDHEDQYVNYYSFRFIDDFDIPPQG